MSGYVNIRQSRLKSKESYYGQRGKLYNKKDWSTKIQLSCEPSIRVSQYMKQKLRQLKKRTKTNPQL